MAYTINATDSGLESTSVPLTGTPFTMACWFRGASTTSLSRLMSFADTGTTNNYWAMQARGDVAGDPIRFAMAAGGAEATADTLSGYTADTWHSVCARSSAANARNVRIEGGNQGGNTTSLSPSGIDFFGIGLNKISTGYFYSGHAVTVAEAAVWNVALSDADTVSLARGFCPLLIRPDALVAYWPLGGMYGNHFRDIVGGYHLTQVGTVTKADHPPKIIYPRGIYYPQPSAAAATPWLYRRSKASIIGGGVI